MDFVCVMKRTLIWMKTEENAKVDCLRSGMLILEPSCEMHTKRKTLLVQGRPEVRLAVIFLVQMTNFSYTPMRLKSGREIGYATKAPYVKALRKQRKVE